MVSYFSCTDTLIRHMAVDTRDTRFCVNTLGPHFKFRMLRFKSRSFSLSVNPIDVRIFFVVFQNLIGTQAFAPRISQGLLFAFKIVFHMALRAYKRSHLLMSGIAIDVIVMHPNLGLESLNTSHKSRASNM